MSLEKLNKAVIIFEHNTKPLLKNSGADWDTGYNNQMTYVVSTSGAHPEDGSARKSDFRFFYGLSDARNYARTQSSFARIFELGDSDSFEVIGEESV